MSAPRVTSRTTALLLAAAMLSSGACRIGHDPAASPVATTPRGAEVTVVWRGELHNWGPRAELIAVADSGLYLLHGASAVLFYPLGSPAIVRGVPAVRQTDLSRAGPENLQALVPYARHPFGLDQGRLERLLAALGRDTVVVRRRMP